MKILGIDQSLNGFAMCVLEDGRSIHSERVEIPKGVRGFARLQMILNRLVAVLDGQRPDYIVMEDYAYSANSSSLSDLMELGGIVKWHIHQRCYQVGRDAVLRGEKVFFTMTQGKMKKFCLGNGATKKDSHYLLAVFERLKKSFKNDDEADAYMHAWMGSIVIGVIQGKVQISDLTSYQQEALIELGVKNQKGLSITKALKLPEAEKLRLARGMELES